MITQEQDVEIHALGRQCWKVPAIPHHVGVARKMVRKCLGGAGGAPSEPDLFGRFEPYVRQWLSDSPHVRATVSFASVMMLSGSR